MLVHDTGYVKVLVAFPAFAVGATGKEAKHNRPTGKALESDVAREETFDLFAPLILRGWHRPIGWPREATQSTR